MLFSGEKQRARKFNSAHTRDADRALEEMFRRSAPRVRESKTPKWRSKIAALVSLLFVVIAAVGLLVWSHPKPLLMMGQTVLHGRGITMMRVGVGTEAPTR